VLDYSQPVYSLYHVWRQALPQSAAAYLVAHSTAIHLIDRDGHLRGVADWSDDKSELTGTFKELIS